MKNALILGSVLCALAATQTVFAGADDSHPGTDCVSYSVNVPTTVSDKGKSFSNQINFKRNVICSLNSIKSTNLKMTPKELTNGRVVGYNVNNARLCWRDAFVGGATTYCGPAAGNSGFGAVNLFDHSNPPVIRDAFGQMFIWAEVPANGYTRIERYSATFN